MVTKILGLLSYGRKIEKYALSAQAISRAFQQLHDDLNNIWNEGKPKESTKPEKGIVKVLADKKAKETEKETNDNKDVQKG